MITPLSQALANATTDSIITFNTRFTPLLQGYLNPMQGKIRKITTGIEMIIYKDATYEHFQWVILQRLVKKGYKKEAIENAMQNIDNHYPIHPIITTPTTEGIRGVVISTGYLEYFLRGKKVLPMHVEGLVRAHPDFRYNACVEFFQSPNITELHVDKKSFL